MVNKRLLVDIFGYTKKNWRQMKAKIDANQYTEEVQNGKKIKYIKL